MSEIDGAPLISDSPSNPNKRYIASSSNRWVQDLIDVAPTYLNDNIKWFNSYTEVGTVPSTIDTSKKIFFEYNWRTNVYLKTLVANDVSNVSAIHRDKWNPNNIDSTSWQKYTFSSETPTARICDVTPSIDAFFILTDTGKLHQYESNMFKSNTDYVIKYPQFEDWSKHVEDYGRIYYDTKISGNDLVSMNPSLVVCNGSLGVTIYNERSGDFDKNGINTTSITYDLNKVNINQTDHIQDFVAQPMKNLNYLHLITNTGKFISFLRSSFTLSYLNISYIEEDLSHTNNRFMGNVVYSTQNRTFCAVNFKYAYMSLTGLKWIKTMISPSMIDPRVYYNKDIKTFVVFGSNGEIAISIDGMYWKSTKLPFTISNRVVYVDSIKSYLVISTVDGKIYKVGPIGSSSGI